MVSNTSSASCAQPPLSLLVEKLCQINTPQNEQGAKPESSGSSSPGSDGKPFTPRTRQRLKDYLCNSNSAAVSSVDEHTPPTDPPKPILRRNMIPGAKLPVKIIPRQYKQVRYTTPDGYASPTAIKDDDLVLSPNILSHTMRQTWARYPPPTNENFPVDEELNLTPTFSANEIDPEGPLERLKQHSEANFVQPLCLQGAIRNEYAVHLADKQQDHDELMKKAAVARRAKAENDAIKLYSFNMANEPIKFPKLGPKAQKKMYDDKANISALKRKIAICDGKIEGMIAGEFTYNKDTAHLPPTKEQVAILREVEGLSSFFPKSPPKLSIYDQWLKDQSADPCPASNWFNGEEKFARKKAFESALSGQLKSRFPSKPIKNQMPTKLHRPDEPICEENNFPSMLPKTSASPEHYNIYETPVVVQVPKWLPAFVDSDIVPIDKSASDENQYKELLTTIWQLESQMLKETKPNKWDKNWHDASPHWTKHHHQTSGG
ncbi:hypothetical protein FPOAC2_12173 [Fusarium poae]|uniref:Uncharacterized protein n=1 Tax=Fusarium poae TaxID=36050 RepID=A0A1B8AFL9_FUSPO|nr:hypothetical protein FPOAC1_011851 [Fusarium poae]KAG8667029.1 hypothetical protein FPOAC1_011851 [Fusarium poae]OBS19269.1 hypothetical protein FPOA_10993 [Fusarium poae]